MRTPRFTDTQPARVPLLVGQLVAVAVLLAGAISAATWTGPAGGPLAASGSAAPGAGSATSFLHGYMDGDGRIVRRDQGGDTVSEGQAYGLLAAVGTGNERDFRLIWGWTTEHLQQPDGLLAWHWQSGQVADTMPAADADLDTAWALWLASSRFHDQALAADARRIAGAVLSNETAPTGVGLVLVAGPWARKPLAIEPGYFSPEAFSDLAGLTGDPRWGQLDAAAGRIITAFTSRGELVPDWVTVGEHGRVTATPPPQGSGGGPAYGLDAARVAPWAAASCSGSSRRWAAAEWPILQATADRGQLAISLSLHGQPLSHDDNAAMGVADAAAAAAAGDSGRARALDSSAQDLDHRYPTYYGTAWLALWQLLSRSALSGC